MTPADPVVTRAGRAGTSADSGVTRAGRTVTVAGEEPR